MTDLNKEPIIIMYNNNGLLQSLSSLISELKYSDVYSDF